MNIEVVKAIPNGQSKPFVTLNGIDKTSTIGELKKLISKQKKTLYPGRIALRLEPKGKILSDKLTVKELDMQNGNQIYIKDLGPQIGWSTVFLCEYAGPIFCYLLFYFRPAIIYGQKASSVPYASVVHLAAISWTLHYLKRILETLFVHRFSHATMPLMNLFKNCIYYWGFASFVSYFNNHPLYTAPYFGELQVYVGLVGLIICELGNFSIHIALRNLRPAGSTERRIPKPTNNPFTLMFNLVSCPNYTYEIGSWIFFTIMTQSVPSAMFTVIGGMQMIAWAKGKQRNYKKEFPNYPRNRKSIIPFFI